MAKPVYHPLVLEGALHELARLEATVARLRQRFPELQRRQGRGKYRLSPRGRRAISIAQKKRWAKVRATKGRA